MLRFFVLALLLINSVYFAWSQSLFQSYGFAPAQQTEPRRLARQIKPETLQLHPVQEQRLAGAPVAPPKPGSCWQAGLFDEAQATLLRDALVAAAWPAGSWSLDPVVAPGRWFVYIGKFANDEALAKKSSELAALKLKFEPLSDPALRPGLSLGGFETQGAANAALAALVQRGVRAARVLPERAVGPGVLLRLPAVDEALRIRFEALKPVLADKALTPCP